MKLDELLKRSKELDREMKGLDPIQGTKKTDIEELVKLWNDNKRILGVQDSQVEARVRVLFSILDNIDKRRAQYMNDINMFKKQLDKTFAITTTEMMKRKELEDLIIKRDRKLPYFNPILELFEKENTLLRSVSELKELYNRIKDYEFEGKSAPDHMYRDFKNTLLESELEEDTIKLRRNQLLNNFETATNP